MSKFMKPLLLTAAASFALTGIALAGPKADVNQDGQITKTEFLDAANAKFIRADADFDGNLTKDEMKALREARGVERAEKRFEKQDLNGDGALTRNMMRPMKLYSRAWTLMAMAF